MDAHKVEMREIEDDEGDHDVGKEEGEKAVSRQAGAEDSVKEHTKITHGESTGLLEQDKPIKASEAKEGGLKVTVLQLETEAGLLGRSDELALCWRPCQRERGVDAHEVQMREIEDDEGDDDFGKPEGEKAMRRQAGAEDSVLEPTKIKTQGENARMLEQDKPIEASEAKEGGLKVTVL